MTNPYTNQQLLRNFLLSSLTTYFEYAVYIVSSAIVARTLKPESTGIYTFTVFFCGLMIALANHGISLTVSSFTASAIGRNDSSQARRIAFRLLKWQLFSIAIAFVIGVGYVWLNPPKELQSQLIPLLAITGGSIATKALFAFYAALGKGLGNFRVGNIASACASLISLTIVVYLALNNGQVLDFLWVYFLTCVLSSVVAYWLLRKSLSSSEPSAPLDASMSKRLAVTTAQSALVMILGTLALRSFEMMSLKSINFSEVAYFSVATMLCKGFSDIVIGVCDRMLLPEFSRRLSRDGKAVLGQVFSATVRYYWFLGMLLCGAGVCLAIPLVTTLYSDSFAPAGTALRWSLIATGISALISPANAVQIALEQQGKRIYFLMGSAALSAVGALTLVPYFGLMGAVASFAITIGFMSVFSYFHSMRALQQKHQIKLLLKMLLAAIVSLTFTAPIWWWNTIWSAMVSMPLFVIGLIGLTIYLQCWSKAELTFVFAALVKVGFLKPKGKVGIFIFRQSESDDAVPTAGAAKIVDRAMVFESAKDKKKEAWLAKLSIDFDNVSQSLNLPKKPPVCLRRIDSKEAQSFDGYGVTVTINGYCLYRQMLKYAKQSPQVDLVIFLSKDGTACSDIAIQVRTDDYSNQSLWAAIRGVLAYHLALGVRNHREGRSKLSSGKLATFSQKIELKSRPPVKSFAIRLHNKMYRKLHQLPSVLQWRIGLGVLEGSNLIESLINLNRRFSWLEVKSDRIWADPFLASSAGGTDLYFEEKVYSESYGYLVQAKIDTEKLAIAGTVQRLKIDIADGLHSSFPIINNILGTKLLSAEVSSAKSVPLFALRSDGQSWAKRYELLEGFAGIDPVVFEDKGLIYLFVGDGQLENHDNNVRLFYSQSLNEPFVEHPCSPISTGLRGSRMAGKIVVRNGKYFRFAQDCTERYGKAIVVYEIIELNSNQYAEVECLYLNPSMFGSDVLAIHTISICETTGLVAFDGSFRI
jgi:O-antigen/teichoic acid export membrane protein